MAPAPAPGPATGLGPAWHLPKQLLGQQSPALLCHQGVETPHWDTGSVPKSLLNSKVENLGCSSTCQDGNASGAKLKAQGWPVSPNQCWPPSFTQCWPPSSHPVLATAPHPLLATHPTPSPIHPSMEGHPPLSAGHHHPPNTGHHSLLSLGHCHPPNTGHHHHPPNTDHRHPSSSQTSQLPGVSHRSRDHQHRCPAVPTRETCRRTRAQITAIFTPKLPWDWVQLGKPQIRKLLAAPLAATSREIAGLGAGMVTAGTTRWVPGRSKQVLQKTGGAPWACREPRALQDPRQGQSWRRGAQGTPHARIYSTTEGADPHYCCDATGVTSPTIAVPLPRGGTSPIAQPQESSSQPQHWETEPRE